MKKLRSLLLLFAFVVLTSQLFTGCVAAYNPYYQPGVVVSPPPVIVRPRPYFYSVPRPYYGYRSYGHGGYGYGHGGGYGRGGYGHGGYGRGR